MPAVVSLLPEERFISTNVIIPEGLNIIFLDQISDCDVIKACEGADCIFSVAAAGTINSHILENIPTTVRLGIPVSTYIKVDNTISR